MGPGSTIDGIFTIEVEAGAGGMGTVYRARDLRSGCAVALKVLKREGSEQRFDREARLLSELEHPSIVGHVAHGAFEGARYLAMEWLEGEDFSRRLRRAKLTVREAVTVCARIAEALAFAHAKGVVHRDLKPSNLFLVDGDLARVKILDFGVALEALDPSRETESGTTIGSPGYMAPEQARGEPSVGPAADVFSLGCVLFECLTGRPAFFGKHVMAVLAKVLLEEAPNPAELEADVPVALGELVMRMLAKDPADRVAEASVVARELWAFEERAARSEARGERTSTRPPAPAPRSADSAHVLSRAELQLVSVLAVGRAARLTGERATDGGRPRWSLDVLSHAAATHGGHLEVLANETLVVTLSGSIATDLAARAAFCALALRDATERVAVGVATGRADLGERANLGDCIDHAVQQMKRAAFDRDRAIHLDDTTDALLDERFSRRRQGDRRALTAFRDLDTARTLLGRPTPFVGREAEVTALEALFALVATENVARLAVFTGVPGVGKSRVRREIMSRLRAREHEPGRPLEMWLGRTDAIGGGAAYGLIGRALADAEGIRVGEPIAVRHEKLRAYVGAHVAPERCQHCVEFLAEVIGAPFPDGSSIQLDTARRDPVLMGDQIRRAWEELITSLARAGPLVLVLEDLHKGDLPSVSLIDAALASCAELSLLVIAFGRPELDELFPDLWRERAPQRIALSPLSRKAAERLVVAALGESTDQSTLALLLDRAAGNAFYLEELIRAAADGKTHGLPQTVVAMVEARLGALAPSARRALRAASVFGQVFWEDAVKQLVSGADADLDVRRELASLVEREFVTRRWTSKFPGEVEYAFRNSLVREAAYEMLTAEDRSLGHGLAGAWLERVGEREALVLAEHFERGEAPDRAVQYVLRAASEALEANDFGAAIELAARGYGLGGSGDDGETVGRLLRIQAEAHKWRGENSEAEARGLQAMERLAKGSDAWFAAAGEVLVASLRLGRVARLTDVVVSLRQAVTESPTPAAIVAIARAATGLLHSGQRALAADLMQTLADHPHHASAAARARIAQAEATRALVEGDLAGYLDRMSVAAASYDEIGDLRMACNARVGVGYAHSEVGELDEAEEILEAAFQDAQRLGLPQLAQAARTNLGLNRARRGDLEGSASALGDAATALAGQGDKRMESAARAYLARTLCAAGDLDRANIEAIRAVQLAPAPPAKARARATQAYVALAQGRFEAAHKSAEEALQLLDALGGIDAGDAIVRLVHAETLRALGRSGEALSAISAAKDRLEAAAARITDERRRRTFLEQVPENRRTLELARDWAQ